MLIFMLQSLYIENLAVIEKACIDFDGGFTVFTGETGAGKSIVIDAINACLGQRASREIARIISTDRVTDLMLQNAASMLKDGKNPVY